ncbi:unnamed protein product [Vitrella brassicaformis CCMP3155]|uniref:Serine aminopeptidase S33 domain-containing protein n=1 Tax=Vitrella brassicaformis (strain CCMP3155) TaxID=1169540 RepID=A0A0G4GU08_VITBC|nr:unnamed protein product [Vitrella brassicaformis CCMP3155]|eukprot:CEM34258.1 unnamed protein product [Vitrella brassicaformis CCMP3155]
MKKRSASACVDSTMTSTTDEASDYTSASASASDVPTSSTTSRTPLKGVARLRWRRPRLRRKKGEQFYTDWVVVCFAIALAVFSVLVGFAPACLLLYQSRHKPYNTDPLASCGIAHWENVTVVSVRSPEVDEAINLAGWYFMSPNAPLEGPKACVAVIHGHGQNMARDLWSSNKRTRTKSVLSKAVAPLWQAGFHVLTVDMRNHGRSGDTPYVSLGFEESHDVTAAVRFLAREKQCENIGIFGESMGGVASLFATAHNFPRNPHGDRVKALVVDSPFALAQWAFESWFTLKFGSWVPPVLLQYIWFWIGVVAPFDVDAVNTLHIISNIKIPLHHAHGRTDLLVPFSHAEVIHQAVMRNRTQTPPAEQQNLAPYQAHVQAYRVPRYHPEIVDFFGRHLLPSAQSAQPLSEKLRWSNYTNPLTVNDNDVYHVESHHDTHETPELSPGLPAIPLPAREPSVPFIPTGRQSIATEKLLRRAPVQVAVVQ